MARAIKIEDVKRGDVLKLWPEDIIVKPEENGRYFEPDIADLIQSILTEGQLQAVRVRMVAGGLVQLVAGYQRHRAISIINEQGLAPGAEKMRIHAVVGDANEEEAFLQNIAENRVRNRTSAVEDAMNIRRLSERYGKTDEEIRAIYSREGRIMSQAWLDQMRKILMLSKDMQGQIHQGELSANVAFRLADMDEDARKEVLELAKQETGGRVTETAVLKAARKKGALKQSTGLKMPEVKAAYTYLRDDKSTGQKTRKLAEVLLKFQSGELPEPDFFRTVKRLLGE